MKLYLLLFQNIIFEPKSLVTNLYSTKVSKSFNKVEYESLRLKMLIS